MKKKAKTLAGTDRLEVEQYIGDLDMEYFNERTFSEVFEFIRKEEERTKQIVPNTIRVILRTMWAGYDGGVEVQLYAIRPETDKEYKARTLAEEKERQARQRRKAAAQERARKVLMETEAQEKALLKKLLDKYGDAV